MTPRKQSRKQSNKLHVEILRQMITLATSGLGLVSALAWNNVIQELVENHIKPYLPEGSGLVSLFLYAVIITALAVVIAYHATKLGERISSSSVSHGLNQRH
ncbi:MAG: DUF5654 family protein [bacterium]|nr:DUF5654 family protein [bacterium]